MADALFQEFSENSISLKKEGRGQERSSGMRRRGRRGRVYNDDGYWIPSTRLGNDVRRANTITKVEQVFYASAPVREFPITDSLLPQLEDRVLLNLVWDTILNP